MTEREARETAHRITSCEVVNTVDEQFGHDGLCDRVADELFNMGAKLRGEVMGEASSWVNERVGQIADLAREEAANICERMVIGGRAWTHDQEVAASALLAAAKNIRSVNKNRCLENLGDGGLCQRGKNHDGGHCLYNIDEQMAIHSKPTTGEP